MQSSTRTALISTLKHKILQLGKQLREVHRDQVQKLSMLYKTDTAEHYISNQIQVLSLTMNLLLTALEDQLLLMELLQTAQHTPGHSRDPTDSCTK